MKEFSEFNDFFKISGRAFSINFQKQKAVKILLRQNDGQIITYEQLNFSETKLLIEINGLKK